MNRKVPVRFGGGRLEKCLYSTSNSLAAYPVHMRTRPPKLAARARADLSLWWVSLRERGLGFDPV